VDNAIKYLDPARPGKISISCVETDQEYTFSVKDNGRGIAAADCEMIFDPFRRSGKQDRPGEGLGLAYVRTLVRKLGGRVWCESELGAGTTMNFTVPANRV
jgi:signal transduction histidine kinase